MKIILVEDEAASIEAILERLAGSVGASNISVAANINAALLLLTNSFFDLLILDLKIPSSDDGLDANPSHGHFVFNYARVSHPGMPILVLTGSPSEDFIGDMLRETDNVDIWGTGQRLPTTQFLQKYKFGDFSAMVDPIITAVKSLEDIELVHSIALTMPEDRLLRIFTQRTRGARCVAAPLSGGLSGVRVVRLRVTDAQGTLMHNAVAKLGPREVVMDEGERFNSHVSRLPPSITPRHLATLTFGAGPLAGIFYGLAEGCDRNGFDFAKNGANDARSLLLGLEDGTKRWVGGASESRRRIIEIRRRLLNDETYREVVATFALDWTGEFEQRPIQTKWGCCHGDFHGGNIMVDQSNVGVIIDYGDVEDGPASLDPVTLELSTIFHPDCANAGIWPTVEQCENWGDLARFTKDCQNPEFIILCREWAQRVAAGPREIAATAYAYVMRQLKYDGTDKSRALALLIAVRQMFDAT